MRTRTHAPNAYAHTHMRTHIHTYVRDVNSTRQSSCSTWDNISSTLKLHNLES